MGDRRRRAASDPTPGILTLARVTRKHWHAVQLDVLRLGYRKADMFTTLTVDEMMSIVLAAPPGTAVHHSRNGGWTTTDHLLATMSEYQAGLVTFPQRLARPGVTDLRPSKFPDLTAPGVKKVLLDSMTIDEYEQRRKNRTRGGGV